MRTAADLDILRKAAAHERDQWGGEANARTYPQASAFHLAVAEWLDQAAKDVWAYGPPDRPDLADDDDLLNPHLLHAVTIARHLLGIPS